VVHIGKIGGEQEMVLGGHPIVQTSKDLDIAVPGNPKEIIAKEGNKIVHEVIPMAPQYKIEGGHPGSTQLHPSRGLQCQAQVLKKGDHRAQTGLADGELPEIVVEVRGEQIEVEVGIKEQPLGGKVLVVVGVQGNPPIGAEIIGIFI